MKSRTIEIIDNHIKALEEELEWYQQRNVEWQKIRKLLDDGYKAHKALKEENARLREQLRWHSVEEKPRVAETKYLLYKVSEYVLLTAWGRLAILSFYNFDKQEWMDEYGKVVQVYKHSKWCYIPDDNQGTDCTPEGE